MYPLCARWRRSRDTHAKQSEKGHPRSGLHPTHVVFVLVTVSNLVGAGHAPCRVTDHGAKGDSHSIDTAAINRVLANASCQEVIFPTGHTFVTGTIVLQSHKVLSIERGASIEAAAKGHDYFLPPEPNPWDAYQDFGHSHWANSLFYGHGVVNVTVQGGGAINGAGQLSTGTSETGDACKMWGIVSSADITLTNLTLESGGWFTLLATNVSGLRLEKLNVQAQRDGFDIVGCRDVVVNEVVIEGGGDDAVVFKSDFSVGTVLHSRNLTVTNCVLGCGCNGLNFGSETVGNISSVLCENVTVTKAGKAGIGIVSMDGAHISNVTYRNISMTDTYTPLFFFIGNRLRRPDNATATPGSISNIYIDGVNVAHAADRAKGNVSATIDGLPGTNPYPIGPDISVNNVKMVVPGGGTTADGNRVPPHDSSKFPPRYLGVRPAFGWFVRTAFGVTFCNVSVGLDHEDGRSPFLFDSSTDITLENVCASRGTDTQWDVVLRNGSTVQVTHPGVGCPPLRVPTVSY